MTRPRFSIVAPTGDWCRSERDRALRSILRQTCRSWELLVPDGLDVGVLAGDPRVRIVQAVDASAALRVATGELVGWLEPNGWLDDDALAAVDRALGGFDDVDHVYTDEVVHGGGTATVMRKPDWSPERQRGQDYCGQLSLYRRSLAVDLGGVRSRLGDTGRHDLSLRVAERARRTLHLPQALYHRQIDGAESVDAALRPVSVEAVEQHLARQHIPADVWRRGSSLAVRRRAPDTSVSIVVPTAGATRVVWGVARALVVDAVRSVLAETRHPRFEVVVVVDPATPSAIRTSLAAMPVVLVDGDGPFDFSARCNAGVAASQGEHVVLLNDDVLVEQPEWLSAMVGYFAEPDVGVVGARLLHADGTLQHGGILLNVHPRHVFAGFAGDYPGPFDLLRVAREVSAVTGACLATPRAVWDELGGLSSEFAVAFNDIDYCLRAAMLGKRTVWTPEATLYHFESQSRDPTATPSEVQLLEARWGHVLRADPYGSPAFEPGQELWLERQRPGLTDLAHRAASWLPRRPRDAPRHDAAVT